MRRLGVLRWSGGGALRCRYWTHWWCVQYL